MSFAMIGSRLVGSLGVVALTAGLGVTASPAMADVAVTVPVANPSFEEQVLGAGGFFFSPTPITGWTATATGGSDRGV